MINKEVKRHKGLIFASIIGLVLAANILLSAVIVFINYPTESHRTVARQLDVLNTNMLTGTDFTTIMDSKEYKELTTSPEANYINTATGYTLILNAIVSIAIIGGVYYYLRKHRVTSRPVGTTVLLVAFGQLAPLVLTQFGVAMYLGTQIPSAGPIAFMLFIGLIIAPLLIGLFARIFDWYYGRKRSFVIE